MLYNECYKCGRKIKQSYDEDLGEAIVCWWCRIKLEVIYIRYDIKCLLQKLFGIER